MKREWTNATMFYGLCGNMWIVGGAVGGNYTFVLAGLCLLALAYAATRGATR